MEDSIPFQISLLRCTIYKRKNRESAKHRDGALTYYIHCGFWFLPTTCRIERILTRCKLTETDTTTIADGRR